MPLLENEIIQGQARLGIWHIKESAEFLRGLKKFSGNDLEVLKTFTYEPRKKEWLAARILTEKLTGNEECRIVYDKHGKPSLQGSKQFISLSHSHDLLAVILDKRVTGIDIEILKTKVISIKDKFMSKQELSYLQNENEAKQLTVCWCVKEALYKLYGKKELTFKENLLIEPFTYAGKGIIKGWIKKDGISKSYQLQYRILSLESEQYILAYVINQV